MKTKIADVLLMIILWALALAIGYGFMTIARNNLKHVETSMLTHP